MAKVGRPLKFQSVEELQKKIDEYFAQADALEEPYTITGLALYLGCDRDTLLNYEDREEFFGTIKRAKLRVENFAEKRLYSGQAVAGVIFALKNFGWKDKTETDITSQGQSIVPILGGASDVSGNNSNKEDSTT